MDGFKAVHEVIVLSPEAAPQLQSAVHDVLSLKTVAFSSTKIKDHLLHPKHWKLIYSSVLKQYLFSKRDICLC